MIDWARVAQLRDEIGGDDFDEVTELFLMEVEDTLMRLDAATGDAEQFRDLLHFLKGSALNLGFHDMSEVCSRGEADAASGRCTVDVGALRSVYSQSRALFETEYSIRFAA